MLFHDRKEAGELLAQRLEELGVEADMVVAIPRGGVVTGKAVADKLGVPLWVIVTKKLGAPGQAELAIGAVAEEGEVVRDEELMSRLGVEEEYVAAETQRVRDKIRGYVGKFRNGKKLVVEGKRVVVVDDGIATGATMKAAVKWLEGEKAQEVVVATPVCAGEAEADLQRWADKVVCLETPAGFGAVGQFYEHFPQVTDEEVVSILKV